MPENNAAKKKPPATAKKPAMGPAGTVSLSFQAGSWSEPRFSATWTL